MPPYQEDRRHLTQAPGDGETVRALACTAEGDAVEKRYWLERKRSAMAMAHGAATAKARLIHYDLAGRYSIKASQCAPPAAHGSGRASGGDRAVLHLAQPKPRPLAALFLQGKAKPRRTRLPAVPAAADFGYHRAAAERWSR